MFFRGQMSKDKSLILFKVWVEMCIFSHFHKYEYETRKCMSLRRMIKLPQLFFHLEHNQQETEETDNLTGCAIFLILWAVSLLRFLDKINCSLVLFNYLSGFLCYRICYYVSKRPCLVTLTERIGLFSQN